MTNKFLNELYYKKIIDNIKSIKYGKTNEKVVLNLYRDSLGWENLGKVGFLVIPGIPFQGWSPDSVVYDVVKKTDGLVEVKCSISKKGKKLEEACQDTKFYLKKVGENIELSESSLYYSIRFRDSYLSPG